MASEAVVINGRFLTQRMSGVQRYAFELLNAWTEIRCVQARILVSKTASLAAEPTAALSRSYPLVSIGRQAGHAWEQTELRMAAGDDFLVNLCNTAPLERRAQLVTIHDAAVWRQPTAYNWRFRSLYKALLPAIARKSLKLLTVSKFSAGELCSLFQLSSKNIEIVPNGADHILRIPADETVLRRNGLETQSYLLAVGGASPHKNIASLAGIEHLLSAHNLRLVCVGSQETAVFARTAQAFSASVCALGAVTDGELRALYENALGLIFPSLYEGFGIPPAEAMACGCPVLSSTAAALPEVCGEAALYFDPRDRSSLFSAVTQFLGSPRLRSELREAGLERVKLFCWLSSATEFNSIVSAC